MKRAWLLALSILPGSTAILRGRAWLGTGLMVAGFLGWDFAFLGLSGLWYGEQATLVGFVALAVGMAATGGSVTWTYLNTCPHRALRSQEAAERALRDGYRDFLRGKLQEAELTVDGGLARAPQDVDLVFFRWQLGRASGDDTAARRYLERLKKIDERDKWLWEIQEEEGIDDPA